MKHILFIGDLRSANNYGAIATTTTLIDSITSEGIVESDIKYVDYKSIRNPTPIYGWKSKGKLPLKTKIKKHLPHFLQDIWNRRDHYKRVDFVPYLYSQYECYYRDMLEGKRLQYEKNLIEWSDIVFINGEGNIVNGTDRYGKYRIGALYILFMAWVAKVKYEKTVCLVNHTVDPANEDAWMMIENIYPKLDYVYLRERLSISKLKSHGISNVQFVPDALFMYKPDNSWVPSEALKKQIDFTKPYICIGDSSGIKNAYNSVKWNVESELTELIKSLQGIVPQVIFVDGYNGGNKDICRIINKLGMGSVSLNNCSYHDLYHVLSRSELFISGRWHASILSVLSGTPILLWGSDSHKTRSLYDLLDYPYPFFEVNTMPIHRKDMVETAAEIIQRKREVSNHIIERVNNLKKMAFGNVGLVKKLYE